ncbi:MAG: ABC transporter substrate-binding protein [Chloroflexi bacterium]|nr:ABC transporter substrate-binding protein [Chloroflexota bacterium]
MAGGPQGRPLRVRRAASAGAPSPEGTGPRAGTYRYTGTYGWAQQRVRLHTTITRSTAMTEPEATRRQRPIELSRRSLLRGGLLGGVGLAAAALLGCTQDEDPAPLPVAGGEADPTPPPAVLQTPSPTAKVAPIPTPTPTPLRYLYERIADAGMLVQDPDLPYPYQFPEPPWRILGYRGTLRIAATFSIDTMDPAEAAAGGAITVPNMVYNRLLGMVGGVNKDPFGIELEPELASAWERTPDGVTFTFHLRGDVQWQNVPPLNGRQFVASDARFAFERYRYESVHKPYWADIGSLDTPDDVTLNIHMSRVTADFILPLASRYQPIFPKELVDSGEVDSRAVGTGPMILTQPVEDDRVAFARNPEYWEREVLLDRVEFLLMHDPAARLAAFRVGQVDYAHGIADNIEGLRDVVLETNPDTQVNMRVVDSGRMPLSLNLSNAKFADERVRRAMTLAMDTQLISDVVYEGLAKNLPLHPWVFAEDEEPRPESDLLGRWFGRYDPPEARRLLAAAGAEGLRFGCVYHNHGTRALDHLTDMILGAFPGVGITMESRHVDESEFDAIWTSRNLAEASTSAVAPGGFQADHFFHDLVHSESPKNLWRLNDPQVDAWAEAQQVELDPGARREIHRTMWEYFMDKMFWPPLPSPMGFEVYQPWLRGVRFGGILGTNSSEYDWGDQITGAWLDANRFDQTPRRRP